MREIEAGVIDKEPSYISLFEALDNKEAKMNFMKMLGFEPVYDEKGNIIGWEETKRPTYKDILMAILNMLSSKKVMGIANIEDVEPLSEIEVELKVDLILELIDILTPPDEDVLPYLPAIEWAKLEMKKGLTLAENGMLVKALAGIPVMPAQEPEPITVKQEERKGLLDKLLGRE